MVQDFCQSGRHEGLKGCVHGAAALMSAVMATYNATAYFYRRDAHLRVNAIVYTMAALWEVKQTVHHLAKTPCAANPTQREAA
jgi:hypothetical protein